MSDTVDVRRLDYMPLYVDRLRRSKTWLRCKRRPELAFYLMNLWMRAYRELPAGSIENDDDVLADAAMCDVDEWDRVKVDVLRDWEEVDGRLHHPVVVEIAAEAFSKLRGNQKRTEAARETKAQMRLDLTNPLSDPKENVCHRPVTGDEAEAEEEEEAEKVKAPPPRSTTPREPASPGGGGASLEDLLREAAGTVGDPSPALRKTGPIERLIAEGVSLEHVILPAVRGVRAEGRLGRSWAYYVQPIRERVAGAVLPAGSAPQLAIASVWVARDSPQGEAWDAYARAKGPPPVWLPTRRGVGRYFLTEMPPVASPPSGEAAA